MSYSIIFETKIVKLSDGRFLHLSLQGCNNDNEGRDRHDFRGKIYTAEDWENEIKHWESIERHDGGFDLRIGSRYCQWADYGKHLRTMTKRAKTWDELKEKKRVFAVVFRGINFYPENEEPVFYPADAEHSIDDIVYGIWYGRIKGKYSNEREYVYDINDIITEVDKHNGKYVSFYIS